MSCVVRLFVGVGESVSVSVGVGVGACFVYVCKRV